MNYVAPLFSLLKKELRFSLLVYLGSAGRIKLYFPNACLSESNE